MVEAAFKHHGINGRYINMEVPPENLADAVRGLRATGFRGFNLSMPHKVTVIPLLDGLGESASVIGAVNCVVRRGDKLIGENTDGKGFLRSLTDLTDPKGKTVVLFGAGERPARSRWNSRWQGRDGSSSSTARRNADASCSRRWSANSAARPN